MNWRKSSLLIAALLIVCGSAVAQFEALSQAMQSLEGDWNGTLTYRDYSSDQQVELPHRRVFSAVPDGSFFNIALEYQDPDRMVYGHELYKLTESGVWSSSTGRDRLWLQQLDLISFEEIENGWEAQLEYEGQDNDQPAMIRSVWQRQSNALTIETQVIRDDGEALIRNRVELERAE